MIVFLNGPFGVGKSTLARLLVARLPGAILLDPEEVGTLVRRLLRPVEAANDYQDYALWRALVVDVARRLREQYGDRPLIIPMTVVRHDYFEEMTAGLRSIDPNVVCLRLTVSRAELRRRIQAHAALRRQLGSVLTARGPWWQRILAYVEGAMARRWRLDHLDDSLSAGADPAFGREIQTEGRTPESTCAEVLQHLSERVPAGGA